MALAPSCRVTYAAGTSPQRSSGTAITATSSTAGWSAMACSTSTEAMFSPPEMITSLLRSFSSTYPSGCSTPRSPVRNQPSGAAALVASGSLR